MSDWKWVVAPTQANLLRVIEQLSCGLTIEDETGCIIYANERVLEWSQYRVEELEGQPVEILVPDELHERLGTERTRTHAGDQRTRLTAFQRKDGQTFPVAVSPQMLEDDAGERHAIALFVDLGELQTARPMGATEGSLATELANVALKLNSMTFSASLIDAAASAPVDHPLLRDLSEREREVLTHLMAGSRVSTIADQLFISHNTVRNHLKAIFRKVNVSSQNALIEWVRGLGKEDDA